MSLKYFSLLCFGRYFQLWLTYIADKIHIAKYFTASSQLCQATLKNVNDIFLCFIKLWLRLCIILC